MPGSLFAATDAPTPDPQTRMPRSARPACLLSFVAVPGIRQDGRDHALDITWFHQPSGDPVDNGIRDPSDLKPMDADPTRGTLYGRGMPKLPLSEDQIDDLVAYLATLQ